jgi:hypothetical protein
MKAASFSCGDDKFLHAMCSSPIRPTALAGERRLHVLGPKVRSLPSLMLHITKETLETGIADITEFKDVHIAPIGFVRWYPIGMQQGQISK